MQSKIESKNVRRSLFKDLDGTNPRAAALSTTASLVSINTNKPMPNAKRRLFAELESTEVAAPAVTNTPENLQMSPVRFFTSLPLSPSPIRSPVPAKSNRPIPLPDMSYSMVKENQANLSIDESFTKNFAVTTGYRSQFLRKIIKEQSFDIHCITTLSQLITEKAGKGEQPDFRFLIGMEMGAWFARETHPKIPSPVHFQMTGESNASARCITAGNMFLTNDYSTLVRVNHKSGDFRPDFDSLKWFIVILLVNESRLPFKFAETLTVDRLDNSGGIENVYEWKLDDMRNWVNSVFADPALTSLLPLLQNQPTKVNPVNYTLEPCYRQRSQEFAHVRLRNAEQEEALEVSIPTSPFSVLR